MRAIRNRYFARSDGASPDQPFVERLAGGADRERPRPRVRPARPRRAAPRSAARSSCSARPTAARATRRRRRGRSAPRSGRRRATRARARTSTAEGTGARSCFFSTSLTARPSYRRPLQPLRRPPGVVTSMDARPPAAGAAPVCSSTSSRRALSVREIGVWKGDFSARVLDSRRAREAAPHRPAGAFMNAAGLSRRAVRRRSSRHDQAAMDALYAAGPPTLRRSRSAPASSRCTACHARDGDGSRSFPDGHFDQGATWTATTSTTFVRRDLESRSSSKVKDRSACIADDDYGATAAGGRTASPGQSTSSWTSRGHERRLRSTANQFVAARERLSAAQSSVK